MRLVLVAVVAACGSTTIRPVDVVTVPTNGVVEEPIAAAAYDTKMADLRATLARGGVEIDTRPVVETCVGSDLGGRCVRCEVARRADTAGLEPDMIDAIAVAFARYPDTAFAAIELRHVALCRTIRYSDDPGSGPAGVAVVGGKRVLISIEHFRGELSYDAFTIEQVVHHEVFHMLDYAINAAHADSDPSWRALNPPGFAYHAPAEHTRTRPAGFVDIYATTNETEDRASVFEYLLGQPSRLCELAKLDAIVAAKTRAVWKRAAGLVGEARLSRAAPCVAELIRTRTHKARSGPRSRGRHPRARSRSRLRLPDGSSRSDRRCLAGTLRRSVCEDEGLRH